MTIHDLKVWPEQYEPLASDDKPFEIRRDDRGYAVGDTLRLREWDHAAGYSGRETIRGVSFILRGGQFGLAEGFVAMGLARVQADPERPRPIETAPKNNTLLRLLVDYTGEDSAHPLEDDILAWTVGFNNDDNVGEGEGQGWQFAGWSWQQDHFTEGRGKAIGWLPFHGQSTCPAWPDTASLSMPRQDNGAAPDPVLDALTLICKPWILQGLAHALRKRGMPIPMRAEAEFAAATHWLIGHALGAGTDWRTSADAELEAMKPQAVAP